MGTELGISAAKRRITAISAPPARSGGCGLSADSASAADAAQIVEWIRKSAQDIREWKDIGGTMEIRQDGPAVHVRFQMDAEKTRTMLAERARSKAPRPPGKPGKVVIHGMEGGTKEVLYSPSQQ